MPDTIVKFIVIQAVSQNAQDKIYKLEAEVSTLSDELATQRRALESAWSDNSDLKRTVSELKLEKEELRGQIGMGELSLKFQKFEL